MKLVTFKNADGQERVGCRVGGSNGSNDGSIIDLQLASEKLGRGNPEHFHCMQHLITYSYDTLDAVEAIEADFAEGKVPQEFVLKESETTLLSPCPRPPSMRDGYAFRQHVETARRNRGVPMIPEFDEFPVFYFTNHQAVTGPGDFEVMDRHLEKLDFELEVGMVVGKSGRNIKASEADDYIFGFCIMNDWSARALQMQEMKLNLGPAKGKDFGTTLGPYLVPRRSLEKFRSSTDNGEQHDLKMRCWVNDKQLSEGNFKDMSWTFGQILERVSYGVDIYPGDVIGSGTVGTGCLLELNGSKITDNQWLQVGDKCVMEIDELGRLENSITQAKD